MLDTTIGMDEHGYLVIKQYRGPNEAPDMILVRDEAIKGFQKAFCKAAELTKILRKAAKKARAARKKSAKTAPKEYQVFGKRQDGTDYVDKYYDCPEVHCPNCGLPVLVDLYCEHVICTNCGKKHLYPMQITAHGDEVEQLRRQVRGEAVEERKAMRQAAKKAAHAARKQLSADGTDHAD